MSECATSRDAYARKGLGRPECSVENAGRCAGMSGQCDEIVDSVAQSPPWCSEAALAADAPGVLFSSVAGSSDAADPN